MLEAYDGEWNKVSSPRFAARSLDDLYRLVDRHAAARPVSSHGGGARGDHAWVVVRNPDFSLAAYFGEDCLSDGVVRFHLYGPCPPGPGRDHAHPFDGRGLSGAMTTACLNGLLALLDEKRSPVDYVRESAVEVDAVTG
jgi:hypothetical protein